jgi:hypothetical protein
MIHISKHFLAIAITAALAFNCQSTDAQEDGTPETTTGESATLIAVDDGGGPSIFFSSSAGEMSTPLISGISGRPFSMPAPDPWNMIGNPSVQMDLDLVDDQKEKIQNLKEDMSSEMRGLMAELQGGKINLDAVDRLKSAQSAYKDKMMDLLLPSQQNRLKQIALQMHMKSAGTTTAITNKAIAEALEITPEQTEKLQAKSKELQKKLAEQIEQLKEKMKNELLAELTPAQREKLKELRGDNYESKKSDWSDRFEEIRNRRKAQGN